jgi:hypothetical protein
MTQTQRLKFHPDFTIPKGDDWIWVFGSDAVGRSAKGDAKVAHVNFKASYGVGSGLTGKAYAIPTKDKHLSPLPLAEVAVAIGVFLDYARTHPKLRFFVSRADFAACGHPAEELGPLFALASVNCSLPNAWRHFLPGQNADAVATV